jgi:hypothetical protein
LVKISSLGSLASGESDAVGLQRCTGEERPETVVQLTAQPRPFLLSSLDHALPRSLKILG